MTVELRGFGWRHAGRRRWALRGVDLRIERGERVLLLGPSGSGKSTLLAALAGLLAEDSGEQEGSMTVDGSVGIVFQDPQTQLALTRAGDDVAFGLENLGVPAGAIWPRVDEALAAVGFPYGRDRDTHQLSGGEQQRLALAGVLAQRPDVLLLDEPTANLDPAGARLVRDALRRVRAADLTLVLVEHRVAESLDLVDRVVALSADGGLLAAGTPDEVFSAHGATLAGQGIWVPGLQVPERRAASPPGETLLRAEDVGFRDVLDAVDLDVRAGEAVAIVGPNGAGKSTLALLLGGLRAPTAGRISMPGVDGPPHRWRARDLAGRVGSVFQNPEHQFLTSRVRDEVAFGGGVPSSTVDELLARLRLDRLADANPYTLSGGEQRRLSVATVLARDVRVLVLDEPTFGQDRRTWLELVDLLAGLRDEGRGLVTVTHDADVVAALGDRSLTLESGRVLVNRR